MNLQASWKRFVRFSCDRSVVSRSTCTENIVVGSNPEPHTVFFHWEKNSRNGFCWNKKGIGMIKYCIHTKRFAFTRTLLVLRQMHRGKTSYWLRIAVWKLWRSIQLCLRILKVCLTIWIFCLTISKICLTIWEFCLTIWKICLTIWEFCLTIWNLAWLIYIIVCFLWTYDNCKLPRCTQKECLKKEYIHCFFMNIMHYFGRVRVLFCTRFSHEGNRSNKKQLSFVILRRKCGNMNVWARGTTNFEWLILNVQNFAYVSFFA